MKATRLLFAVLIVALSSPSLACVDTLWTRGFGTPSHDICTGITDAGGGDFMLCGYLTDQSTLHYRGTLIRLTPDGDTLGMRQFGGYEYNDFFHDVRRTSDGGFICAGITASYSHTPPGADFWLLKTNADGDSVWSQNFGGQFADQAKIAMEVNGGYMIAGRSNSFTGTNFDIFVVKTDANGDSLWGRTYGGEDSLEDNCNAMIQTPNGDVILVGNSSRDDNQFLDLWILRINSVGDTVWTRRFAEYGSGSGEAIIAYDGGYLIAGHGQGHGMNDADGLLLHINQSGDVLWSQFYGDSGRYEYLYNVHLADDGGLALFGTYEDNEFQNQYWIVKANPDGGLGWTESFGGDSLENFQGGAALPDGRYLLTGGSMSSSVGGNDWFIVMTEPDTCNMPPYGFRRLYPEDGDSIEPTMQLTFFWNHASDLNSDEVQYIYNLSFSPEFSPENDWFDTTTTDTFVTVNMPIITYYAEMYWSVHATDGQDSAEAQNGTGVFNFDVGEYADELVGIADQFSLSAFPNPFNSTVSISYTLPRESNVQLSLYDITGRQSAIMNRGTQSAGEHRLSYSADDLPSGVYFLRAEFGNEIQTKKLLLLK